MGVLVEVESLKISDFSNNFSVFVEECYLCYLSIWQNELKFNDKPIVRCRNLEDNKEKDFWGVVEGHSNDKVFDDLSRYESVPYLRYVLQEVSKTKNDDNSDIIWFRFSGKVNILSKKFSYFVVMKEANKIVQFVTSYPISEVKRNKIIKKWEFYLEYQKSQSR